MGKKDKNKSFAASPFDKFELVFSITAICLIIPLIYTESTLDPTLAPRLLFLNIVVLLLFLFSLRLYYSKRKLPVSIKGKPIFILSLIYLLISVISLFNAINPAEGVFDITKTFLVVLLFFFLTHIFIRNNNFIDVLAKTIVLSALIATAIGFYQYSVYASGRTEAELYTSLYNIKGLMTHKNQLAIFIFLMLPLTVYGSFYLMRFWKTLSILACMGIIVLILLLQTRSVWIGTALFVFIVLLLTTIYHRNFLIFSKSKKIIRAVLIAAFAILSSITFYIVQSPSLSKLMKYKLISIYDLDSETNRGRLQIAKATIEMIRDNPILGVGAGNWKINYPVYYSQYQGLEFKNWRRPHNDFIWILAEKGFIGFVVYLTIVFILFYYSFKLLPSMKERKYQFVIILITASLLGYLAISNFSFPYERVIHQTFLSVYVAIVISLYNKQLQRRVEMNHYKNNSRFYILLIVPLVFSTYYSIVLFLSDTNSQNSLIAQKQNNFVEYLKYNERAFTKLTTIDQTNNPFHFHGGFALFYLKRYNEADNAFLKTYSYHPYHHGNLYNIARSYTRNKDYEKAIHYYHKVLEVFPFYEIAMKNLAISQFELKNYKEAYKTLLHMKIKADDTVLNELMDRISKILNSNEVK